MYAAAAAVFVLLIGVGVLLYTFLPLHNTPIAMNKTAEVPAETSKQAEEKLLPATGSAATEIPPAEDKNETQGLQKAAEANSNKDIEKLTAADKKTETKNTAEGKKEETLKHVGNASSAPAQQVTVTFSGGSMAENTMKEKSLEGFAADNKTAAAGVVQHETKAKAEKQNRNEEQPTPAAAYEMRGSIAERVEVEKPVLITLDDAMKNFDNGEYKKSAEQFDEILKAQPENADALYFGGISDYINGNGKRAEKSFDKLMKKGTKFLDGSKWYKANILLSKGKKEEARKLLDELSVTGGSYKERAIKKRAEMDF
jgi:tetratricopeptide (TPR) repeat protein